MPRCFDPSADAHWRHLLGGFPASGLSVREFCARHGVHPSSFYARRRALAANAGPPAPAPGGPLFVPLRVASPEARPGPGAAGGPVASPAEGRIEVLLEGGVTVRVFGEVPAARLASVLEALRPGGGASC